MAVRADWIEWDLGARGDLDILLIAPAPAAELSTGVRLLIGDAWTGLRVGVNGNAVIAVVANSLSGSVFVSMAGGYTFD